ncbi:glycosyltransferase family 2 protein [Leeuwenhoekiella aequorea]|uniref:glycosyltransferase family 2 protein n=1 Tax=Leeuwenhoekiella aequorea TaxID=283736 RepID=UPI00352DC58E|tara:strand:- start:4994 stop:5848 length:855 start_codon:yes stop_codon:yes gene_type:complete
MYQMNIAVLMTCHNRKAKTLECLNALFFNSLPEEYKLEVFLVDDGSTDGTREAVEKNYPSVKIIKGDGNLYWNQGMRLAWKTAADTRNYDFYLWLNDDTLLDFNAITELLSTFWEINDRQDEEGIITGACRAAVDQNDFSYGGRTEAGPVIPDGTLQSCTYINGNAVLISKSVFYKLGNLSPDYTHGMGDFDYSLRARELNIKCYTTKNYIATCPPNEGVPDWCNPNIALKRRWAMLFKPLGLNLPEYKIFRKKFWGNQWRLDVLKVYVKVLFPSYYSKVSRYK